MKRLLYICSVLLILASCHDLKKQKQLERIDKMLSGLRELDDIQAAFERDSVIVLIDSMKTLRAEIAVLCENDTINKEVAQQLEDYKTGLRALQKFNKNDSIFLRLLNEERNTLHALKLDIAQGNGDRSSYSKSISFEEKKYKTILTLGTKNKHHYTIGMRYFYAINPEMIQYKDHLTATTGI